MPFESEKQRKAMYAAASGRSNIGIPKEVAKKFIKHSKDESPEEPTSLSTPEFIKDEGQELNEAKHQLASIRHEIEAISRKILGVKVDNYLQKAMQSDNVTIRNGDPVPRFGTDSELWQTKKGENKNGGLNEKGRESYNKEHHAHLKPPQPEGGARKSSFCARMKGMKEKLTSAKTANDPDSRINKSLRKWKCDADEVKNELSNIVDALIDYAESIPDEDPCWQDYHQIGMKEKDGKEVPNCVPDSAIAISDVHGIELPALESEPIAKDAGAKGRASGILFLTDEGETLMIRRGDGGDYPRMWAVPGGHQEPNESLEDCARRECFEEVGIDYKGKLEVLYDDGQFCTYIARNFKKCEVKINDESTGYDWCPVEEPPMPLHPGQQIAMQVASIKTEYNVAELIKNNILPSPQMYANIMLLAIRITGTGLAYRGSIKEYVWRDSSLYLNDEFLKRCNGLMVIMDHPETAVLNGEEFKNRAVGSIMLPYIKGDEVWGIAKIYDQDAIDEICEGEISTSPSVVFDNTAGNTTLTTENGEPLLIEGVPFLLDHIAIVTKARGSKGVWDKGGKPAGVLLTNPEVSI
jgi:8-oxo-dGTP pyrophosphatase MutT (NUDIX family)